jgi:cytochrome c-type biogenesis protein CcmH/NrfG
VRTKLTVAVLVIVVAAYLAFIAWKGYAAIRDGGPVGLALGIGLLLLPLIGAWVVVAELRFGAATQRLAAELQAAGRWPTEELPLRPSGRPEREAADALFTTRRTEVEAAGQDWGAWFRLGLAYDDAGDRRRARSAMRTAIKLHG